MTMKQNLITDIIQGMLPYLNNVQSKRLQEVLQSAFVNYEITENTGNMKESERNYVEIFLSAKRIEGCSEKSLRYYKATIEAMLATLDKNVEYIVTDDIREYLTQYQQKNDLSKVTIDNIRRILSSFFSWLEDEDYILKNPVRRIHKVKTGINIKETYSDEALELMRDNCTELRDLANITMNRIDEVQHINTSMDKLPSRARRKVKSNSIIYSTVRPNQLHYGIIKEQPENFLVSTGFTVIDVNMEKAVPDYIYYVLTQKEITEHLQAIAEQSVSAYPSLKPSDIENLEVLLPDIDTQKATVAILGVIDEKIKQNTEINNNLVA